MSPISKITILLLIGVSLSCSVSNESPKPPNIIIFLVDDMGLMDSSVPFVVDEEGEAMRYPLNEFYHTPKC